MIEPAYYNTVEGGLDWYGLIVRDRGDALCVEEGRIGISDNPLVFREEGLDGGYYVPYTEIPYDEETKIIDLVLSTEDNDVYFLVRSDDAEEQYDGDVYRILLTLAIRQSASDPWLVAVPVGGEL